MANIAITNLMLVFAFLATTFAFPTLNEYSVKHAAQSPSWTQVQGASTTLPRPKYYTETPRPKAPLLIGHPGWWNRIAWSDCEHIDDYHSMKCKIEGAGGDMWSKPGTCYRPLPGQITCEPPDGWKPSNGIDRKPYWQCDYNGDPVPDYRRIHTYGHCHVEGTHNPLIRAKGYMESKCEGKHENISCEPRDDQKNDYQKVLDYLDPDRQGQIHAIFPGLKAPNPFAPTEKELNYSYVAGKPRCFQTQTEVKNEPRMDQEAVRTAVQGYCSAERHKYGEKNSNIQFPRSNVDRVLHHNDGWTSKVYSNGMKYVQVSLRQTFGVLPECKGELYLETEVHCFRRIAKTSEKCAPPGHSGDGISIFDRCIVTEVDARYLSAAEV
ncbi:hypothetical protein BDV96DRAFT_683055 [Lophiotrema nucula]|uniref:Uncharacterized protein n=1 Tax=Lophiotrema nucula TaxID=690887 RepID=A0A6A5ZLZ1_9PLEO|nr:hypothetical protein BDV96DRAFT_683055 [Lophiotrema nucula]